MKKNILIIISICLISLVLTFLNSNEYDQKKLDQKLNNLVEQKLLNISTQLQEYYQVNISDQLVGYLKDYDKITQMLEKVYEEKFKEDFPESEIDLGNNVSISKVVSLNNYEDKDDEIVAYLEKENNFSFLVYKITVSNDNYFYVKDLDTFEKAKEVYLLNYISKSGYDTLMQSKLPDPILGYGSREMSIKIEESFSVTKALAPNELILKDESEIVQYLSYGYNYQPVYYQVKLGDTVEGVARAVGQDPLQIQMINPEISSLNQVLYVGMDVEVTELNSPIHVVVEKEVKSKEILNYKTQYIEDPNLSEGKKIIMQYGEDGYKDNTYIETYVNGELSDYKLINSSTQKEARTEIIKVGTKFMGIGTGKFIYPVKNVYITCRWGCYAGHRAIDVVDRYNRYGGAYAADHGVVIKNTWTSTGGWEVTIDHKNGYKTRYAHFKVQSPIKVGTTVMKGQRIGTIGSTGLSTGPHVHFMIFKNDVPQNPCHYLGC